MYNKILVPLALDQGFGHKAIEIARKLKSKNGEIIAVHVFEPIHNTVSLFVPDEHIKKVRQTSKESIVKRIGEEKDIEAVLLDGHPAREITQYAKKIGADCIVMGSHKPELLDYLIGSTASHVIRHAPCAVHVLR